MVISDCTIGKQFTCGGRLWQITDIGIRTVLAIPVSENPDWMCGPPYAIAEIHFDEYDLPGCELIKADTSKQTSTR